jgi:imidazolonepropionase-like amidohydrolase
VKTLILSLLFTASALAQGSFAIKNATLHLGNGQVIQQGLLHVHQGKIAAVVDQNSGGPYTLSADVPLIDGNGWNLYPGFILMNTVVGLTEIDAVRATLDFDEVGNFSPEVEGHIAFNAASSILPTLRQNGVLFAEVSPRYGMLAGSSSLLRLDGKPWTESLIKAHTGMHVHWPRAGKEYAAAAAQLQALLIQAAAGREGQQFNALRRVIQGEEKTMLHVQSASDWQKAMEFFRPWPKVKIVVLECRDCEALTQELAQENQAFVGSRIWELPPFYHAQPQQRWLDFQKMSQAGLLMALDYEGDMEAMGGRNLGFMAGTLKRVGFEEKDILPFITLNPARILGLDQHIGSLEVGKEASFFACQGSPLEALNFNMIKLWSQGIEIPLKGRQETLKDEFDRK